MTCLDNSAVGIRLSLHRDLPFQYPASPSAGSVSREELSLYWEMLGSPDYLRPFPLFSLGNIPAYANGGATETVAYESDRDMTTLLRHSSDILAFPLEEVGSTTSQVSSTMDSFHKQSLLCLTRVSVSSLAFDYSPTLADAANVLDASISALNTRWELAKNEVTKECQDVQFDRELPIRCWKTLGGPDIVCMVFPKSSADIALFDTFLRMVRLLPVSEIISTSEERIGHAFSSVQGNLCFRNDTRAIGNCPKPGVQGRRKTVVAVLCLSHDRRTGP